MVTRTIINGDLMVKATVYRYRAATAPGVKQYHDSRYHYCIYLSAPRSFALAKGGFETPEQAHAWAEAVIELERDELVRGQRADLGMLTWGQRPID